LADGTPALRAFDFAVFDEEKDGRDARYAAMPSFPNEFGTDFAPQRRARDAAAKMTRLPKRNRTPVAVHPLSQDGILPLKIKQG
jgi:hypothetical protein